MPAPASSWALSSTASSPSFSTTSGPFQFFLGLRLCSICVPPALLMSSHSWCGATAPLWVPPLYCCTFLPETEDGPSVIHDLHSTYAFASLFFSARLLASLPAPPSISPVSIYFHFLNTLSTILKSKMSCKLRYFFVVDWLVGLLTGWVLLIFQYISLDLNLFRGKTGPEQMIGYLETLFFQPSVHIHTIHGSPLCIYLRVLSSVP